MEILPTIHASINILPFPWENRRGSDIWQAMKSEHIVDGSEIPSNHLGCKNPIVKNGITYLPQLVNTSTHPNQTWIFSSNWVRLSLQDVWKNCPSQQTALVNFSGKLVGKYTIVPWIRHGYYNEPWNLSRSKAATVQLSECGLKRGHWAEMGKSNPFWLGETKTHVKRYRKYGGGIVKNIGGGVLFWILFSQTKESRWWFEACLIYNPDPWGNDPIWLIFFKWVETTN